MASQSMASELDQIGKVTDPEVALTRLREYVTRGEAALDRARLLRRQRLVAAREAGMTWRRLAEVTGLSEQYLRREAGGAR